MRMSVIVALLAATIVPSRAVLIDFDDGTDGSEIGAFYAGLGVTFTNGEWDNFVSPDEGLVGAGGLKLVGIGPDFSPKVGSPVIGVFSTAMSAVSIRGLNVGANGARIDAYDAAVGGSVVDFDEAFGVDLGTDHHPLLSVAAASIWRIELYQPLTVQTEGLLFDNLEFTPAAAGAVPEPGTLALLGFAGLAMLRRRR